MNNYNSENTHVLATHMQAGNNKRMLLFHVCENGRHEYVIGSYFTETPYARVTFGDVPTAKNLVAYSWDWGHYFGDGFGKDGSGIVNAVDYWKREVLGVGDDEVL